MILVLHTFLALIGLADAKNALNKVLLISFDGFKYSYIEKYNLTGFRKIQDGGAWSSEITSIFPSATFPNQFAIVTGRDSESHGIVANDFYDPTYGVYSPQNSAKLSGWWEDAVPIWKTATSAGIVSFSSFWLGSEMPEISGLTESFYKPFGEIFTTNDSMRLDTIRNFFTKENGEFMTEYFTEPDATFHKNGPDADEFGEVGKAARKIDKFVRDVLELLPGDVNLILCSDHGGTALSKERRVFIPEDVIQLIEMVPDDGAFMSIRRKSTDTVIQDVFDKLSVIPHLTAYKKLDIPAQYRYTNNDRIGEIFVIADYGYRIITKFSPKAIAKEDGKKGGHGYDISNEEMRPILLATGPAFKKRYKLTRPAQTKDIYPLVTRLLGITPRPHNASNVLLLLLQPRDETDSAASSAFLLFLGVFILWA